MKRILTVLLLFALIGCWSTSGNSYTSYRGYGTLLEPLPTSEGELIYQESGCVMCHGILGDGDGFLAGNLTPRPTDFTNYDFMKTVSDKEMISVIRGGPPAELHPAFRKFTENQLKALIVYLRSFAADTRMNVTFCPSDEAWVVDTYLGDTPFQIEVRDPKLIQVKKDGDKVVISPNKVELLKEGMKRSVEYTYVNLIREDRPFTFIAVKLQRCSR